MTRALLAMVLVVGIVGCKQRELQRQLEEEHDARTRQEWDNFHDRKHDHFERQRLEMELWKARTFPPGWKP